MTEVFIQISVVLGIALVLSLVMKLLRQPLIIGYILTGLIAGPAVTGLIQPGGYWEAFAHMGVALLLFIVGLGLRPQVIKEVGKVAVITGVGQVVFTTAVGYFIAITLGFSSGVSFYLAFAFALSSTIIIVRLLQKKKEQDSLYGRISIGFLLVQDLIALLLFLILPTSVSLGSGQFLITLGWILVKFVIIIFAIYILIKYLIPRVDKLFAHNREMLFLFAMATCFVMAAIFYKLQFSLELGALVAGVVLSVSPYQREIGCRLESVRDFFLIIFFVLIGTNIHPADIVSHWSMILVFSLFIIIGNPLILLLIMRGLKYTLRTSFNTGLIVAQISEFSLILIALGVSLGHVPASILGPVTVVGLITIIASTYLVTYNHQLYRFFRKFLCKVFKDASARLENEPIIDTPEVILLGCHRQGGGLARLMKRKRLKFLVVDHDPEVIKDLARQEINCLYGSADDPNLLDSLPLQNCKLVVCTIPEEETALAIVSYLRRLNKRINIVCVANQEKDVRRLYRAGATYVVMPLYLGRRYLVDLFERNLWNAQKYRAEREKHIFDLRHLDFDRPGS